jgi:hypothetical protein
MDALLIAVVAFLVAVVIYCLTRKGARENFVSEEARKIHATSRELFDKKSGTVSFSEFKSAIPSAEAVLYTDTRNLWKNGQLTPEKVQSVL